MSLPFDCKFAKNVLVLAESKLKITATEWVRYDWRSRLSFQSGLDKKVDGKRESPHLDSTAIQTFGLSKTFNGKQFLVNDLFCIWIKE